MNKLTQFLTSLFQAAAQSYQYPESGAITTIEYSEVRTRKGSKHNPKTRSIRLIVESVIGKNYARMFSDKLKNGRKIKFYRLHTPITEEQLTEINNGLSALGVTAVRHDYNSLVVKYWEA